MRVPTARAMRAEHVQQSAGKREARRDAEGIASVAVIVGIWRGCASSRSGVQKEDFSPAPTGWRCDQRWEFDGWRDRQNSHGPMDRGAAIGGRQKRRDSY